MDFRGFASRARHQPLVAGMIGSILAVLAQPAISNAGSPIRNINSSEVVSRTIGVGSTPGALLKDGTVCATKTLDSSECKSLGKLPLDAVAKLKNGVSSFDGIFDLQGDGSRQVFVDYWRDAVDADCQEQNASGDCDEAVLSIYRKAGNSFHEEMKLIAPTLGYAGGAWFLDESPRKAIFRTRCGGSSGTCLFYLDLKMRSLKPITGEVYIEGAPDFEDVDGDGTTEILVPGRGRDRTSSQGAVLLHWTGYTYKTWWPNWRTGTPYVMYAELHKFNDDSHDEIVAVLDPGGLSSQRQLGIWKLVGNRWVLSAKSILPNNTSDGDSEIGTAFPLIAETKSDHRRTIITLDYGDQYQNISCHYLDGTLRCPELLKANP
jgi:hypothetical protein